MEYSPVWSEERYLQLTCHIARGASAYYHAGPNLGPYTLVYSNQVLARITTRLGP